MSLPPLDNSGNNSPIHPSAYSPDSHTITQSILRTHLHITNLSELSYHGSISPQQLTQLCNVVYKNEKNVGKWKKLIDKAKLEKGVLIMKMEQLQKHAEDRALQWQQEQHKLHDQIEMLRRDHAEELEQLQRNYELSKHQLEQLQRDTAEKQVDEQLSHHFEKEMKKLRRDGRDYKRKWQRAEEKLQSLEWEVKQLREQNETLRDTRAKLKTTCQSQKRRIQIQKDMIEHYKKENSSRKSEPALEPEIDDEDTTGDNPPSQKVDTNPDATTSTLDEEEDASSAAAVEIAKEESRKNLLNIITKQEEKKSSEDPPVNENVKESSPAVENPPKAAIPTTTTTSAASSPKNQQQPQKQYAPSSDSSSTDEEIPPSPCHSTTQHPEDEKIIQELKPLFPKHAGISSNIVHVDLSQENVHGAVVNVADDAFFYCSSQKEMNKLQKLLSVRTRDHNDLLHYEAEEQQHKDTMDTLQAVGAPNFMNTTQLHHTMQESLQRRGKIASLRATQHMHRLKMADMKKRRIQSLESEPRYRQSSNGFLVGGVKANGLAIDTKIVLKEAPLRRISGASTTTNKL